MKINFNNLEYRPDDVIYSAIRDIQLSKEMRALHKKAHEILTKKKISDKKDVKIIVTIE